jgi:hypothetical protein
MQTGVWDDTLDSVEVPEEAEHLWNWFWEIRKGSELTFNEIEAYCRLNRLTLTPWEAGTLRMMDSAVAEFTDSVLKKG